jgi:hypothetical protein
MTDLRPLSVGEIVDRSASFWRANWKELFKIYLGFQLGEFALLKGWEIITRLYFPLVQGGQRMVEALQTEPDKALVQFGGSMGIFAVVMFIYVLVGFFTGIAGSHFIWARMVRRAPATIADSLGRGIARLGTTFGFFGLMVGWTLIVGILLLVPGAAAMAGSAFLQGATARLVLIVLGGLLLSAGSLLAILWFVLRFLLASQVIALEDVGAWQVFQRCGALSSGSVGAGVFGFVKVRLAVLVTVVGLILFAVSLLFGLPALIIQAVYGNLTDPMNATPEAIPQLLMVPAQLLQVIAQSLVGPLFVVFSVVFYADMRVRREGLDLELKLKAEQA